MRYHLDYYKDPLPIHLSWLAMQTAVGTGLSACIFLLLARSGGGLANIVGR